MAITTDVNAQKQPQAQSTQNWQAITGKPSKLHPPCPMAVAAEIGIQHDHFDEPACFDWSAGKIINRHLRSDLELPTFETVSYDTPGIDEDPEQGCGISLASESKDGKPSTIQNILESLGYDCQNMSRHQLDWTFLAHHVQIAYRRYHAHDASTRSVVENMRLELSDFEKAEALAMYANSFGIRGINGPSAHACDVLLSTSNCGGISMSLFMLAQVAGIPARLINTINHSTAELFVNGRWLWSDNIVGSRALILASYQEMLADPKEIVCLTPLELKYQSDLVPHYRAPYNLSTTRYWKGPGWQPDGADNDCSNGQGYSIAYDPSSAEALYPGRRQVFHVAKAATPMLELNKLGGWIFAALDCSNGISLRKTFSLSACNDNPITAAVIRLYVSDDASIESFTAHLSGHPLQATRICTRYEHLTAIEYAVDAGLLGSGLHECVFSCAPGCTAKILLYPDVLANSPAPSLDQELQVGTDAFFENKITHTQQA